MTIIVVWFYLAGIPAAAHLFVLASDNRLLSFLLAAAWPFSVPVLYTLALIRKMRNE